MNEQPKESNDRLREIILRWSPVPKSISTSTQLSWNIKYGMNASMMTTTLLAWWHYISVYGSYLDRLAIILNHHVFNVNKGSCCQLLHAVHLASPWCPLHPHCETVSTSQTKSSPLRTIPRKEGSLMFLNYFYQFRFIDAILAYRQNSVNWSYTPCLTCCIFDAKVLISIGDDIQPLCS